ncbi:terminase large subunit domain-containing protein, partial [Nocardioides massiliensis]
MTSVLPDPLNVWEQAARAFELRAPNPVLEQADVDSWRTPGTLAARLTRSTVQTPALALVDDELQRLMDTPDGRLIITMPPQEGKSTRVAKDFPTWVLKHRPWTRIVGASYGQGLANRNGRAIRNLIASNPELGMSIAADNGSASEWQLAGQDGGLVSVGIGAGLTGRPADLMIIDDPIKDRKEADSEVYRQSVWDWWTDVASTRLAPGAQVVLILTRWHDDDLAGRLLAAEDGHLWR